MNGRAIQPREKPVSARLDAAPSKSVTHRALIAAALAEGRSRVIRPLDADDTRRTAEGLSALGCAVEPGADAWTVHGGGGRIAGGGRLWLGESGTSCRLLAAVAAIGERPSVLDGAPRLQERPIVELTEALEQLGARVAPAKGDRLPLDTGGAPLRGGAVRVRAERSSQFASALMLIGPTLSGGLDLQLVPPAVSLPYVDVTASVLAAFGATVERLEPLRWRIEEGGLSGGDYVVEGDHSSASYFLAAAAVLGGQVSVGHLSPRSAQADARFGEILEQLGCRVERGEDFVSVTGTGSIPAFDLEVGDCPDLVPTLAVLALFAEGPSAMRDVAHLTLKESDRLEVLADNLNRLGRKAEAGTDALVVGAGGDLRGATIRTASDHRMAMAFAVAGLRLDGIVIDDPDCVSKSNPDFWTDFERLRTGS